MRMCECAPIALFVYNRLNHVIKTIEALKRNTLATLSDLYIFSDGPKNQADRSAVQDVRDAIGNVTGFKSINIVTHPRNLGLSKSIVAGVSRLCDDYGRVIVVEDDIVTSPYFLKFMNDGLNEYCDDLSVISIHGYMYPTDEILPETFFLRGADCWGWATWRRGWELYEPDGRKLLYEIQRKGIEWEFNYNGTYNLVGMLKSQIRGSIDSWGIRWYASAFLHEKLTLYPGKSLVVNVGNDNSGVHCGATEMFTGELIGRPVDVQRIGVSESQYGRKVVANYFKKNSPGFLKKCKNKFLKNFALPIVCYLTGILK